MYSEPRGAILAVRVNVFQQIYKVISMIKNYQNFTGDSYRRNPNSCRYARAHITSDLRLVFQRGSDFEDVEGRGSNLSAQQKHGLFTE